MPLSNHPDASTLEHNPDLDELPAAADDLARARERFMDAVRHSTDPCGDRTEIAAADLLRQAVSISYKLRRALAVPMVGYALLWKRAHPSDDYDFDDLDDLDDFDDLDVLDELEDYGDLEDLEDHDDPDDFEDPDDFRLQTLDKITEQLELMIDNAGKTSEGRSSDGRVRAVVDQQMRLIELELEPGLLSDPTYRAAVVEAVNAGLGPVARQRREYQDGLLPETEAVDDEPEAADGGAEADAVWKAGAALVGFDEIQLQLARFLAGISRGAGAQPAAVEAGAFEEICRGQAALVEETCLQSEEWLGEGLPVLEDLRRRLPAKTHLPDPTPDDLTELEGLEQLFLDLDLDEDPHLEQFPGADLDLSLRFSISQVARKIQLREASRKDRLFLQRSAERIRSRMAEVESRTFEGHSRDGLVTARADGTLQLIDLEVDADRLADAADLETGVLDAINAAIDEAAGKRTSAGMIMPHG